MRPSNLPFVLLFAAACGTSPTTPEPKAPATVASATAPASTTSATAESAADPAAPLIGTTPPEWQADRWLNTKPLTLAGLRGKVVLVRWWTAGCPYCSATAPALRTFARAYGERGLEVIGMYHHKDDGPFDPRVYEDTAKQYGFTFPVAFDPEWHTLQSWMRDKQGHTVETGWTSVTFLLDKHGVVRHVHPGGQYVAGDASYAVLTAAIERLLAEP